MLQGYNCPAVVDGDDHVIVAMGVSNQPPDVEHLVPMLERTIANAAQVPQTFIADAGYWSEANAKACEERGADPHIATGRQPHGKPPPPIYGPIPKDLDAKGRMARKLRKKKGKEIYATRKTIVEPVFGQTKEGRGLRRFLLRGLEKVNGEWQLWCTTHNLNKLLRYRDTQPTGGDGNRVRGATPPGSLAGADKCSRNNAWGKINLSWYRKCAQRQQVASASVLRATGSQQVRFAPVVGIDTHRNFHVTVAPATQYQHAQ